MSGDQDSSELNSMDILAAAFFVVAGAWLIIALLYSTLVVVFLRLRARGQLGSIYEEDFGRVRLGCGESCYIPLGCLFRRYIRHIQLEAGEPEISTPVNFMTRSERRNAMHVLLSDNSKEYGLCGPATYDDGVHQDVELEVKTAQSVDNSNDFTVDEHGSCNGPVCSICLGDYERGDMVMRSRTCPHEFHRDCILDWLERQAITECPCCRLSMVEECDVWSTVKTIRKLKRKNNKQRKKHAEANKGSNDTGNRQESQVFADDSISQTLSQSITCLCFDEDTTESVRTQVALGDQVTGANEDLDAPLDIEAGGGDAPDTLPMHL